MKSFWAWIKSFFSKKEAATAAPTDAPRQSVPTVKAPEFGTIVESVTAAMLYGLEPPPGLADPVYWLEKHQWFSRSEVKHVRATPVDPAQVAIVTGSTLDTGERELVVGHPVPFRSQEVPGRRIFWFKATQLQHEVATAAIPGGVGRGYLNTSVTVRDSVGNVINGDSSITDVTNTKVTTVPGNLYDVEVVQQYGGAVSVVLR